MSDTIIEAETGLGKALKDRRERLGITQKELADYCALSHNGISQIETAQKSPRLSTLLKLGGILGFKVVLRMED